MRATLESTDYIVEINGVPGRVWEGVTEKGARITAVITRVTPGPDVNVQEFERDLMQCRTPREDTFLVMRPRMIL